MLNIAFKTNRRIFRINLSEMLSEMFNRVRYIDAPCPNNVLRLDNCALPMIASMHRNGVRLDVPFLRSMSQEIAQRQAELVDLIHGHIGNYQYRHSKRGLVPFQVGSRDHLSQLLFEYLKIQGDDVLAMTPKGKRFEVSEDVLQPFENRHPIVSPVLEWHELNKLLTTYVDVLPTLVDSDSRLHTTFNATIAATGRLSSSKPNLQNIPIRTEAGRRIRLAFIASKGCCLVSTDLNQIEMVWAAHLSGDEAMQEIFRLGKDMHDETTCKIFHLDPESIRALKKLCKSGKANFQEVETWEWFVQNQRLPSKTLGFLVLYEGSGETLQLRIKLAKGPEWTVPECDGFIEQWYGAYPKIRERQDLQHRRVRRYGLTWDPFGRVRLVPEAKSAFKHIVSEGERKASNHEIQSGAQGTIKLAMGELFPMMEEMNRSYRCWAGLQIHDELLSDVDKRIVEEYGVIAQGVMEKATPLAVPVRSSLKIGERWGELS